MVLLSNHASLHTYSSTQTIRNQAAGQAAGKRVNLTVPDHGSDIIRVPQSKTGGGLSLEERVRLLELKLNSHMGWMKDPQLASRIQAKCKNVTGVDEHYICSDHFPKKGKKCLVYDFGIREQPEFGIDLVEKYGCEVHAFDPSPISVKWAEENKESLSKIKDYYFHPYGAGGEDGYVELYSYSWQQVSNIRIPVVVSDKCEGTDCELKTAPQKAFELPVKTLKTIMRELGHAGREISILKLDVEGSEYGFLEEALDTMGCLPVDQLTVEWHHYTFDNRYGGGSSPELNALSALLNVCGLKQYHIDYADGGFPDGNRLYKDFGMKLYFNTGSYTMGLDPMPKRAEEGE